MNPAPVFIPAAPYQHDHSVIERGDFVAALIWAKMSDNVRYAVVSASPRNVLEHVLPRCGGRLRVACHAATALVQNSAALNISSIDREIRRHLAQRSEWDDPSEAERDLERQQDEYMWTAYWFDHFVFRAQDNDWSDERLTAGEEILL